MILYSAIGRGGKIIAESGDAQFKNVILVLLERIKQDERKSYVHEGHSFNYVCTGGYIYICVTPKDYPTRISFAFLQVIEDSFQPSVSGSEFSSTLSREMTKYSNKSEVDRLARVQKQVDEVKEVMMENIDKVLKRGERLEDVMAQTDAMRLQSDTFKKNATKLKTTMWWKNVKLMIAIVVVILFIIFAIIWGVCGLTFSKCRSDSGPPPPTFGPSPTGSPI
eukprot:TRINITY_DN11699_c0_g1_i1.p1 TRINITY_DN11699_c0_g1~~TRINITY_DN11699_c0_g1_i1.p1  ORF type:complete len:222 (-),score=43.96 TRINITY_DN11699_c0_g1_i1:81-746(-)